ncbi:MAG: hypothetical protein AAF628_38185 [Planctomycetota bacterium]
MTTSSHFGFARLLAPTALVALSALAPAQTPFNIGHAGLVYPTTYPTSPKFDREADVAYDATTGNYLVAWEVKTELYTPSGQTFIRDAYSIRFQRVNSFGLLLGSTVDIANPFLDRSRPRVANLNQTNQFLIVWEQSSNNGDIYGCTVDAASGAFSAPVPIANTSALEDQAAVAGEATTFDNDALVVWRNQSASQIRGSEVSAAGPGVPPSVMPSVSVAFGSNVRQPSIAAAGDLAGRLLVAWAEDDGSRGEIWGRLMDRSATFLNSAFPIYEGRDAARPAVTGEGTLWVVAFQHREVASANFDIAAQVVRFDPVAREEYLIGGTSTVEATPGQNETRPSVAWLGESVVVNWQEANGAVSHIRGKTIDPHSCLRCQPGFAVDNGTTATWPAIASEMTSQLGSLSNGSLQVFTQDNLVCGALFRGKDGLVIDVGGGCGQGGLPDATCAVSPNVAFRLRVLHSQPNQPAVLFLSAGRIDAPLTPTCTLIPDPLLGVVLTSLTSARGNTSQPVRIPDNPALVGARVFVQWAIAGGSGYLGFDLSNTLSVRIG